MKYDTKGRIIGCGYCALEKVCKIRDPKINKAKLGCLEYTHHENTKIHIK